MFEDEGEVLVVPPPAARHSTDFEMFMYTDSYGPGYRHLSNENPTQRSQGYVVGCLSYRFVLRGFVYALCVFLRDILTANTVIYF